MPSDAISEWAGRLPKWAVLSSGHRLVFEPLEQRCMLAADVDFAVDDVSAEDGSSGDDFVETTDIRVVGEHAFECSVALEEIGVEPAAADGVEVEAKGADVEEMPSEKLVDVGSFAAWFGDETIGDPWLAGDDWLVDAWGSEYDFTGDWYADDGYADEWYADEWYANDEGDADPLPSAWLRGGGLDAVGDGGDGGDTDGGAGAFVSSERGPHFSLSLGGVGNFFPVSSAVVSPTATVIRDPSGGFGGTMSLGGAGTISFEGSSTGVSTGMFLLDGETLLFACGGPLSLVGGSDFPGVLTLSGGTLEESLDDCTIQDEPGEIVEDTVESPALEDLEPLAIAFSTADVDSPAREPASWEFTPSALAQAYALIAGGSREAGEASQSPSGPRRGARR